MEVPILYHGREVGTLRAVSDGLYWQLTAWCEAFSDGVQRLYGASGLRTEPFGVFAPGNRTLHLHRRVSKQSCPVLPEHWAAGREEALWRPWCGEVEGQFLPDAMLRRDPNGSCMLAVFAPPKGPVPLAEYVSAMEEGELGGRACLILRLTDAGLPVFSAAEDQEEAAEQEREGEEAPLPEG